MKKTGLTLIIGLLAAGAVHADTVVEFDNLNYSDGAANDVLANGSAANLTVVRSSETSDGLDYLYLVTYTGADYDGDLINDTLTYTVRVSAMNGNTVTEDLGVGVRGSTGSVTLDGTDADVELYNSVDESWAVSGGTEGMSNGDTLIFTVENLSVDIAGYTATFAGFDYVAMQERTGFGHTAVEGVGTGLSEVDFNANSFFATSHLNDRDTLYVSANNRSSSAWGVTDLDYSITVIPEPATLGLISIFGMAILVVRRLF